MLAVPDLIIVIGFVLLCCFIGYYFKKKEEGSTDDYFLARRQMFSLPAAFSITVSFFSSTAFTVYLGEIYMFGMPIYVIFFACLITTPIVTHVFQPIFYPSPHLSVYHYLEERFSRSVRYIYSTVFLGTSMVSLGVVGFAAAISAEVLAGVPFWISALAVGLLSTAYSTFGGLKAVIWTDLLQALVMLSFFFLIIIKVCLTFDSTSEMWQLIYSGERLAFSFKEGPTHRYSVTSLLIANGIFFLYAICISQPGVQRWKSVASLNQARMTAILTAVIMFLCVLIIYIAGLCIYAFYARCYVNRDSLPQSEKISLYFVSTEMSSWPGVIGLCLGGILSGALSTYSSFINSMASVTLEDFVRLKFNSLTPTQEVIISKALTAIYGILATGLIFLTANVSAVITIEFITFAIAVAPPLATFCMALWCKRANTLGVIVGTLANVTFIIWLSTSSLQKGYRHVPLPLVNPLCLDNETIANQTLLNSTIEENVQEQSSLLDSVLEVSAMWYSSMGFLGTLLFSYLFSLLFSVIFRRSRKKSNKGEIGATLGTQENFTSLELVDKSL